MDIIASFTNQLVTPGDYFSLTGSTSIQSGSVNATSPGFEAKINGILELDVDAKVEACLGPCATSSGSIIDIDRQKIELASVDNTELKLLDGLLSKIPYFDGLTIPVGTAQVNVYKGTPKVPGVTPALAVTVNNLLVSPSVADAPVDPYFELLKATAKLPAPTYEEDIVGKTLSTSGTARVLDIGFDLDGIAHVANPTFPPVGFSLPIGPGELNASVAFDALDVKAGPTVDLVQEFDIMAALDVTLDFDRSVKAREFNGRFTETCSPVFGIPNPDCTPKEDFTLTEVDSWTGNWLNLPDFAVFASTEVIPTFSLNASMLSRISANLGIGLNMDIGNGSLGLLGASLPFGPLITAVDETLNWATFDLFNKSFALGGFSDIVGQPFTLYSDGSHALPTRFEGPGTFPQAAAAVPLPPAVLLMGTGILALRTLRQRKPTA